MSLPTAYHMTLAEYDEIVAKCRKSNGEAHDAHMVINDECAWCGLGRPPKTTANRGTHRATR